MRDGGGNDTFLNILSRGQALGETALLMNCQRTVDMEAIMYVEMYVFNRSDFQQIPTTHPEDRKKDLFAMLSTCMASNEAKGVEYPLIEMAQSVYNSDGTDSGGRIGAEETTALILDVINSDVEDTSIRTQSYEFNSNGFHPYFFSSAQLAAAQASDNPGTPNSLKARIDRIEDLLEVLIAIMIEMRSTIKRAAQPANIAQQTYATRSFPHHHRRLSRSTSSIVVAGGVDASELHRQSYQSKRHDDVEQPMKHQRSLCKLWVIDRAANDLTSATPTAANVSAIPAQHHPPLKLRLRTISSSTQATRKRSVASPTQFADRLFQTRHPPLVIRHSAESRESQYSLTGSATSK